MNREQSLTQAEIIQMAREAGFYQDQPMYYDESMLEAFAKLVAEHEREACAKVCDNYEEWCGPWGQDDNQYAATESAMEIANAIRARGKA